MANEYHKIKVKFRDGVVKAHVILDDGTTLNSEAATVTDAIKTFMEEHGKNPNLHMKGGGG